MAVSAITTRPMVRSLLLARPVVVSVIVLVIACPLMAFAARIQAPAPNAISRIAKIHPNLSLGFSRAPGMSIIPTKQNIAIPNSRPDQRTRIFVAMLKAAASSAKPKKYAQNNGHGMYEGTMVIRDSAAARCRAPNTAKGAAKHKLLKATILSRPRACAISSLAAHSATKKTKIPALHIETTVREVSKNVARMVVCMWMASVRSRALRGARFPGQYSIRLYNEE